MHPDITRIVVLLAFVTFATACQQPAVEAEPVAAEPVGLGMVAEAACGQCQFDLPGSGCDLAVRIDGKAYYVDGSGLDDHGDAHAAEGLCNAVHTARVEGRVERGRFVATSFSLLPGDGE